MEREEYTRDNYPTSGKKYNGEKAIISLTSWRARINTVDKTIYSLIKQCPGFHIVLVLSEEEFPKREEELPERLMLFVENELIELLWVYKNYKSLKKVLFTMDKYSDVPVISADDDLRYTCNYAEELYQLYIKNPNNICTTQAKRPLHTAGPCTLYPPNIFGKNIIEELLENKHLEIYSNADDAYYEVLRKKLDCKISYLDNHKIFESTKSNDPLSSIYGKKTYMERIRIAQSEDCGCDMSYLSL